MYRVEGVKMVDVAETVENLIGSMSSDQIAHARENHKHVKALVFFFVPLKE